MSTELIALLDKALDLTVKIRRGLDFVEKIQANGQDSSEWENKIKKWDRELDRLNGQILADWTARIV